MTVYDPKDVVHISECRQMQELMKTKMDEIKKTLTDNIENFKKDIGKDIRLALAEFSNALDYKYASKEDLQGTKEDVKYWRNIMVSGILLAILLGVIALLLKGS